MNTSQTFTILIWANKAKASKNGLLPLFARVTCNGRRTEISLKRKVPEDKWNSEANKCTGVGPEPKAINQFISQTKTRLFKIYDSLLLNDDIINPQTIKDLFLGKNAKEKTLLEVVAIHNQELKDRIDIDYSRSTHTKFNTLEKKIRKYCKRYLKKQDIPLSKLNYEFVKNFAYFLQSWEKIKSNTTMKYVRMLKKIMNEAVRRSWLDKNPFQDFKCTFKWAERDVLTMAEVKLIEEKEIDIFRLALVRDLFIFSCYTGIAYADIIRLQKKDIHSNSQGKYLLQFKRKKTQSLVKIPLLAKAKIIYLHYLNTCENDPYLFPHLSNQKLNSYLKEIADSCGIDKNLTFHLARHTFATTITLTNGVPIETVSKLLGHSSIRTTQIYAKVVEKKLTDDIARLEKFLNSE